MEALVIVALSVGLIICVVALIAVTRRASKESVGAEIFHIALSNTILEMGTEERNTFINSLSDRTQLTQFPVASHGAINHARFCYMFIARRVFDGMLADESKP